MDQQSTRTDITVNVDGFWMLQALLDIRHVAPELRCRPSVSTDSSDGLNEHPGMAVVREQGIVAGELNAVNEQVAARMRVLAAPRTVASADKVMLTIIDAYFAPNHSVRELRDLIKSGAGIDPLKDFSEAAREEVGTLKLFT